MSTPLKRLKEGGFALLNRFFERFGHRLARFDRVDFFEPLLYRRLARNPRFFFVQIGANDGVSWDPIYPFVTKNRVQGVVVEPLKDMFARLVENYRACPGVRPVNVALHQTAKTMELFRVEAQAAERIGNWSRGIASFHPEHHLLSGTPPEAIVKEMVNCVTLAELLQSEGVTDYDLLQIDTEGYDSEIIRMIDFEKQKPAIIRFEHGLSEGVMSQAAFRECAELLLGHGYYLAMEPYDAVAYQPGLL